MRWSMARARQQFSEVVEAAAKDPQPIYRRDRLVAVIVSEEEYRKYREWKEHEDRAISLADAFTELRDLAAEQGWSLPIPERVDRENLFLEEPDALPR